MMTWMKKIFMTITWIKKFSIWSFKESKTYIRTSRVKKILILGQLNAENLLFHQLGEVNYPIQPVSPSKSSFQSVLPKLSIRSVESTQSSNSNRADGNKFCLYKWLIYMRIYFHASLRIFPWTIRFSFSYLYRYIDGSFSRGAE